MEEEGWTLVKHKKSNPKVKTVVDRIVDILLKHEYGLSDGYKYYTSDRTDECVNETLRKIAGEILSTVKNNNT